MSENSKRTKYIKLYQILSNDQGLFPKLFLKSNDKSNNLNCQTTIVIVYNDCSNPSPVEEYCKAGHGLSLVDVTGNGPEEVGKPMSVAKTGTGSKVANLHG